MHSPQINRFAQEIRDTLNKDYLAPEASIVRSLQDTLVLDDATRARSHLYAENLINNIRTQTQKTGAFQELISTFDLTSPEGITLLSVAEAMLRIPDNATLDQFLYDKLTSIDWQQTRQNGQFSFLGKTALWGMDLGQMVLTWSQGSNPLARMMGKLGVPVIRMAALQSMKLLGNHFVLGQTIEESLLNGRPFCDQGYSYSYDMLGEGARTMDDAERYWQAYDQALDTIGQQSDVYTGAGISIKLSALHPRYELAHHDQVVTFLTERLLALLEKARRYNINVVIDAEESSRLDLSLDILHNLAHAESLKGWDGFGCAVQAYQKRALHVLNYLDALAQATQHRFVVRLVKGAYWDSEIKKAQVDVLSNYPVFTHKAHTDLSFLACAQEMMRRPHAFYPQFGTHNALTVATLLEMATQHNVTDYEFQRLHGMGVELYDALRERHPHIRCRIYAPVGNHKELLPYLVRRLLENGANLSFVHQLADPATPMQQILADPLEKTTHTQGHQHPLIPAPQDLYGESRVNTLGLNMYNTQTLEDLYVDVEKTLQTLPKTINHGTGDEVTRSSPVDGRTVIQYQRHTADEMRTLLSELEESHPAWADYPVEERAQILERAATLLEARMPHFMALCTIEGGRTLVDGLSEVREAADFCRYYAQQARTLMAHPHPLPGPTGEYNALSYVARGVFVCISPWNFPLAIFTGQVVAALVSGNAVLAKPSESTVLIASEMVALLYEAGIPHDALRLVLAPGSMVEQTLLTDRRVAGVVFTGSTKTAQHIQHTLCTRGGPIVPLIAETGGINAMIVDSSALPEQVVDDIIRSAFQSAGQRCSALRILYLQKEIAPTVITMLKGAMKMLHLGNPLDLKTDIGPLIHQQADKKLTDYLQERSQTGAQIDVIGTPLQNGAYFPPCLVHLKQSSDLTQETFGPVLHWTTFDAKDLGDVVDEINARGYGLTMGLHSRLESTIQFVRQNAHVGNLYVNRSMIGAVVGVQPFGGEGLSGTGPKAGGPNYLLRFMHERTYTRDITASGGNTTLLSLGEGV